MDEPDVAVERVISEIDRTHGGRPAAMSGGLRHQRDAHAFRHESDDRFQFVELADLLHAASARRAGSDRPAGRRTRRGHSERTAGSTAARPNRLRSTCRGTSSRNGSCASVVQRRSLCSEKGGRMITAMSIFTGIDQVEQLHRQARNDARAAVHDCLWNLPARRAAASVARRRSHRCDEGRRCAPRRCVNRDCRRAGSAPAPARASAGPSRSGAPNARCDRTARSRALLPAAASAR